MAEGIADISQRLNLAARSYMARHPDVNYADACHYILQQDSTLAREYQRPTELASDGVGPVSQRVSKAAREYQETHAGIDFAEAARRVLAADEALAIEYAEQSGVRVLVNKQMQLKTYTFDF